MEKEKLYKLIDRYYMADTTVEEERELLRELLRLDRPGDKESETLAVMGYSHLAPGRGKTFRAYIVRGMVAASVLILIGYGLLTAWKAEWRNLDSQPYCMAYVGGERIDDKDAVMSLINEQLSEMSAVSAEVGNEIAGDFNDIRDALSVEDL